MFLGFNGLSFSQKKIAEAAGITTEIHKRGMLLEEMSKAVSILAPSMQFWMKRFATISDLASLVTYFQQPAGIEWQGVFEYEDEDDEGDDDAGHYSIVTKIDTHKNTVIIADPYKQYAGKDRKFSVLEFERRWWDINEVFDPATRHKTEMYDYHVIFTVTPSFATFPEELKMERG